MQHHIIFFVIALSTVFSQSAGKLVMTPRSTESKVGETTYFNCSTSLEDRAIFWYHGNKYVYTTAGILDPYRERFEIDWNASVGSYNLVIHSVESGDAGEYICIDDDGFGTRRSAELVVLDDELVCTSNMHSDGVVGTNNCGIKPDEIKLSCVMRYHGNIPPIVEWRKNGSNEPIAEGVSTSQSSNSLIYTLTVNGTFDSNLDNSSFICQTTRTVGRQHSCSSEAIQVLYVLSGNTTVNITLGEEIKCIANSSQSCTYKWRWFSEEDSVTMSNSWNLMSTRAGLHRCEATCVLRNISCTVAVMLAEVHSTSPDRDKLVALLVLLVVPVISILILMFWIKKRKQKDGHINTLVRLIPVPANDRYRRNPEPIVSKRSIHCCSRYFFHGIAGITVLDDELFILIDGANCVEVYDLTEFCLLRSMDIPELEYPMDITSNPTHKHLYIVDSGDSLNKIVTIDRSGMVLNEKLIGDDFGCLSVTKEFEILLAVSYGNPKILVYKLEADLYQTIELPSDFFHPWHAVKLNNGQFLVSHGHRHSKHRVCIINETGDITNEYGGKSGAEAEHLNSPYHLAVDSSGYILVSDVDNSRIVLLDPNLKFIRELISPAVDKRFELRKPVRMHFDEPKGRLYIADNVYDLQENFWKDGRFWVFEVA